jgi:hypothetical protein
VARDAAPEPADDVHEVGMIEQAAARLADVVRGRETATTGGLKDQDGTTGVRFVSVRGVRFAPVRFAVRFTLRGC